MPFPLVGDNSAQPRPTSVRYGVLFFLCTLSLLLYICLLYTSDAADEL